MWRVGARRLLHLVQRRCVVTVPRHLVAMPNATTQLGLLGARPASRYGQQIRPNLRLKRLEVDPKPT